MRATPRLQQATEGNGGHWRGFQFVEEKGPEDNADGEFTVWTEEQVNDPSGPLHRWECGVIKEYPGCVANSGSHTKTIRTGL